MKHYYKIYCITFPHDKYIYIFLNKNLHSTDNCMTRITKFYDLHIIHTTISKHMQPNQENFLFHLTLF